MLSILVENKIINNYRDRHIDQLVGDFNYLGTVHQRLGQLEEARMVRGDQVSLRRPDRLEEGRSAGGGQGQVR